MPKIHIHKLFSLLSFCLFFLLLCNYSNSEEIINSYKTNAGKIIVSKTKITLLDSSANISNSQDISPWVIVDCCTDNKIEHLFVILGKNGAERGERLAIYSTSWGEIEKVWMDKDRGHNPWKIMTADVDGDSCIEICVGVWKETRFHPIFDNRLFVLGWDGDSIFPKWLGSRLSSPFLDFDFHDIDNDGIPELIALELQRNELHRVMSYKWTGFGFEGYRILNTDLTTSSLTNIYLKYSEVSK